MPGHAGVAVTVAMLAFSTIGMELAHAETGEPALVPPGPALVPPGPELVPPGPELSWERVGFYAGGGLGGGAFGRSIWTGLGCSTCESLAGSSAGISMVGEIGYRFSRTAAALVDLRFLSATSGDVLEGEWIDLVTGSVSAGLQYWVTRRLSVKASGVLAAAGADGRQRSQALDHRASGYGLQTGALFEVYGSGPLSVELGGVAGALRMGGDSIPWFALELSAHWNAGRRVGH